MIEVHRAGIQLASSLEKSVLAGTSSEEFSFASLGLVEVLAI